MGLVVITGIPGVGKTTVINAVLERIRRKYEVKNFGTEMFKIAKEMSLVKHRDELRSLSPEQQKSLQEMAAEKIYTASLQKDVIVDTHCFINTPKGYLPGLPSWVLEKLKPDFLVIIEANTEEILRRRAKDEARARDEESKKEIELHKEMNRAIASAYSMFTGATISFVYNHDGKLNEAVKQLRRVLE